MSTMTTKNVAAPTTAKPIHDYTPYLTAYSRAREESAISALAPVAELPGMISFAGGAPNPGTFEITNLDLTFKNGTTSKLGEKTTQAALQYGATPGMPDLLAFFEQLQLRVHGAPKYANPHLKRRILIGNGSQDLLSKAMAALVKPGDSVLVEARCYPGMLSILDPMVKTMSVKLVAVPIDEDGIDPTALAAILDAWPARKRKPHVLYTVPTSQNPTGATTPLARRRAVYAIAQRHDFLVLEDDPYVYLQYTLPADAVAEQQQQKKQPLVDAPPHPASAPSRNEADLALGARFAATLVPSYMSLDTDGRVLRFDSLSKVVGGGIRIGFLTGPAPIYERLEFDVQATSLQPTSLAQIIVLALVRDVWHSMPDLFLAHTARLSAFYRSRRDAMLRAMSAARLVEDGLVEMANVPTAGMFLWFKLTTVKDALALARGPAMDRKVLLLPGIHCVPSVKPGEKDAYVRATYALATEEMMVEGMKRLRECIDLAMRNEWLQQRQQEEEERAGRVSQLTIAVARGAQTVVENLMGTLLCGLADSRDADEDEDVKRPLK
ncbi:hypothetical protein AMAG_17348 [Allomyces macrogynus ATCC 38327]|uniref:Aminotransferase class I/classII large domain-containing protein n=1 Tax=Allomyces macrogynus (strain ATCC 38327) TaxID=578462 RepID=A0A0L0TER7_ALLM3|nr:hypothetical protein AMAG_17348 [Allomyces macrogynus ATCC 38327]|eukprot:KNE73151.1 hypothetical protein AMAG_17348 [Allomyces macrogynus ATCC 38327]